MIIDAAVRGEGPAVVLLHAGVADRRGSGPDGELLELPWAGHLPSLERPAETSRLVLGFLGRHVGRAPAPPA